MAAAAVLAAGAAAWWMQASRYRTAAELAQPAYPLRRIDIDPTQPRHGVEHYGTLRLDVYIGRDGKVDRVEVVHSTMPAGVRDRVVASFAGALWQPARLADGREVRSVKRIEVDFEPPAGARAPMRPDS